MANNNKAQDMNPIWRGVGFIMLLLMTGGSYFVAGWFLDANRTAKWIPQLVGVTRGITKFQGYDIPNAMLIQGSVMIVVAVIVYSIAFFIWAAMNTGKKNPLDADPVRRKIDNSKVR